MDYGPYILVPFHSCFLGEPRDCNAVLDTLFWCNTLDISFPSFDDQVHATFVRGLQFN